MTDNAERCIILGPAVRIQQQVTSLDDFTQSASIVFGGCRIRMIFQRQPTKRRLNHLVVCRGVNLQHLVKGTATGSWHRRADGPGSSRPGHQLQHLLLGHQVPLNDRPIRIRNTPPAVARRTLHHILGTYIHGRDKEERQLASRIVDGKDPLPAAYRAIVNHVSPRINLVRCTNGKYHVRSVSACSHARLRMGTVPTLRCLSQPPNTCRRHQEWRSGGRL